MFSGLRQEYFDSHSTEEMAQVLEELHLSSKEQVAGPKTTLDSGFLLFSVVF